MDKVWPGLMGAVLLAGGCALVSAPGPCGAGKAECPAAAECAKASVGRACAEPTHPDSRNWRSLFNLNLDNAVYTKGVWLIDGQANLTATKDEAIWTDREYGDFVLDLEYRCEPAANSGVLIRCGDSVNWIPNAVEVQILDDNHPHWAKAEPNAKNGGLYGHLPPKVNNVKPAGEWNRMTVTAQGRRVRVVVNGEETVDADLSLWTSAKTNPDGTAIPPWLSRPLAELPSKGRIGLQGKHGDASIGFRNIRIKELR